MKAIAAIDIGTNSIHMLIATIDAKGKINELDSTKSMVRLGAGSNSMTKLENDAIERAINSLKKFKEIADSMSAFIYATATSAVREASNGSDFVNIVKDECGIKIHVIDGHEEAELIYSGVTSYFPVYESNILVIDIGGGSTETIIGNSGKLVFSDSAKLGTIRLTEKFFPEQNFSEKNKENCKNYIHQIWKSTIEQMNMYDIKHVVGTSGTIRSIANAGLLISEHTNQNLFNDITLKNLIKAIKMITKATSTYQILDIPGIDKERADIILAGAFILDYALQAIQPDKMLISPYALREGIVVKQFDNIQ